MKKQEFKKLIDEQFAAITRLTETKGEEYSQSDDQLANFYRQAIQLGVDPKVVLMVYLNKHLDSIRGHVRGDVPESEPIEGRIDDAILYLLLLKAMIRSGADIPTEVTKAKESTSPWGWSIIEPASGQPIILEVAGRYFEMNFQAGTEHGSWSSQQLEMAMQRLTGRESAPTHPHK